MCGNLVVMLQDSGVTPHCCGYEMTELVPNDSDGAGEKHLPVMKKLDDCKVIVEVGSDPHPMTKDHHICFIVLEMDQGFQVKRLQWPAPSAVEFCTCGDNVKAVYEYCNLHGLWRREPEEASVKESCETGRCCSKR